MKEKNSISSNSRRKTALVAVAVNMISVDIETVKKTDIC